MSRSLRTALLLVLLAPAARAQRVQPEIRLEVIGPEPYRGAVGAALHFPVGRYVRVGVGATAGAANRVDLIGRFTFDPQRQMRWALSAGGGLSHDVETRKQYLALHADLEGPRMGSVSPFVSAGLAGGARFAVGIRRALQNRR